MMKHELDAFLSLTPGTDADLTLSGDPPPTKTKDEPQNDPRNDLYKGEDGKEHWGFHLIVDCSGCNPAINNGQKITSFIKHLVTEIKMNAVGMHGDNRVGSMYIDIFSCKPFDLKVAVKTVVEYFSPKFHNSMFLYRDAPMDKTTGKINNLTVGK